MTDKILFISPNATRTGAPIVLLHLLRWLKTNSDLAFDVLLGDSGDLLSAFQALAPTRVVNRSRKIISRVQRKLLGVARFRQWEDASFRRSYRHCGYRLVYSNTACNTREVRLFSQLGFPVLCHVHELTQALNFFAGRAAFSEALSHIRHFIAASQSVQEYLHETWSIDRLNISLIHEFIPMAETDAALRNDSRSTFRRKLGISSDEILVGGCGTLDWRKGADIFIHLARTIRDAGAENIRFLWLGGKKGTIELERFEHDISLLGLSRAVLLVEACHNPLEYFSAMDIFALTSREDPFPLVMLEAASLGLPILCFEKSGGGPEFVSGNAGLVAPYLDVPAFAQNISNLAHDVERRRRLGANAAERVRNNYTIEHQGPKALDLIRRQLLCG